MGAALGALAGAVGGKAIAEKLDPTVIDDHWRGRYDQESYYEAETPYDDYAPAYQLGAQSRMMYGDQSFDEVEGQLARDYDQVRGGSRLDWDRARPAARASWDTDYR